MAVFQTFKFSLPSLLPPDTSFILYVLVVIVKLVYLLYFAKKISLVDAQNTDDYVDCLHCDISFANTFISLQRHDWFILNVASHQPMLDILHPLTPVLLTKAL